MMNVNLKWPKAKAVTFKDIPLGSFFAYNNFGLFVKTDDGCALNVSTRIWLNFDDDHLVAGRISHIEATVETL